MKEGLVMVGQPEIPNHAGQLSCTGTVGSYLPFLISSSSHVLLYSYFNIFCRPRLASRSLTRLPTLYIQASVNPLRQHGWAKFDCYPYILLNTSPEPLRNFRVISNYPDNVLCIEWDAQSPGRLQVQ
jgi:hypothetical protein